LSTALGLAAGVGLVATGIGLQVVPRVHRFMKMRTKR
jgi:hypothetical protein